MHLPGTQITQCSRRGAQRGSGGADVIDHEHPRPTGAADEPRSSQTIGPGPSGLGRPVDAAQQSPDGEAQFSLRMARWL